MKLVGERSLLILVFCVSWLLEGGLTAGPIRTSSEDCESYFKSKKCVNGPSHANYLLAIVCMGLIVLPMLLCCSKGKKEPSKNSPQISKEPVHLYDEIDESLVVRKHIEIKNPTEDTSKKYDRYQSEVEIQKKKLESRILQTSVSSPQDPEAPELPDREYLTDIDFVAQEFDLLLTRAPELPKRMEDCTSLLTSTDVMVDDKATEWDKHTTKQHHGTQQSLIRQELKRSVGVNPKSAPPKTHNVIKGSKALVEGTQSQKKKEEVGHKFPGEVKQRKSAPGFKYSASSANQQPPQKPTGTRPLPYRQPMRAEQLVQPGTGNQDWDTCPTYQNVTEECTYDDIDTVNYQNVTSDVHSMAQGSGMSHQNILSKQKQQITEETPGTYQPLIFHCAGTEEDEYMEMDIVYY